MLSNGPPASRPVNMHLRPIGRLAPAIFDRLDLIQEEVEASERKRRARDVGSAMSFRSCLRALCLDLDAAYRLDRDMLVGVPRDSNRLNNNVAYPEFVSRRPFIDALDGLVSTGHVEQVSLGSEASGKSTRVRATSKLHQHLNIGNGNASPAADHSELIRLRVGKRDKKKRVGYKDSPQTVLWRKNLEHINRVNSNYDIRINLSPCEWATLEATRRAEAASKAEKTTKPFAYVRIDMSRTRLHRVFNSHDWMQGGRFYGAWWQSVPKSYRKHITINGKPICEYDFSAIHLRLLYKKVGATVPHLLAPYDMPYGEGYREVVKQVFDK